MSKEIKILQNQQRIIVKLGKLSITAESGAYTFMPQPQDQVELKNYIVGLIQRRINELSK